jgi:hypothetical protein
MEYIWDLFYEASAFVTSFVVLTFHCIQQGWFMVHHGSHVDSTPALDSGHPEFKSQPRDQQS